jgi:hypothetical protein
VPQRREEIQGKMKYEVLWDEIVFYHYKKTRKLREKGVDADTKGVVKVLNLDLFPIG